MTPGKMASERVAGNAERQARIVRLVIHGKGAMAQRLIEAEALAEQQRATRYSAEHDYGGEAA